MDNNVIITELFERKVKRLVKKFSTLEESLYNLESQLKINPYIGIKLSQNIYKIRISDKSKGKGKSGGFRVITYIVNESESFTDIFLLTIYDKSELSSVTPGEIRNWVKQVLIQRNK